MGYRGNSQAQVPPAGPAWNRGGRLGSFTLFCLAVATAMALTASPSRADTTCPTNQAFRTNTASANLPDCRAYEQATPTDKHGANVSGDVNLVQASSAGNRVVFANPAGLPTTGGSSSSGAFVASRGPGAWTSNGLLPLLKPGERADVMGWDDEIAIAASVHASIPGALYLGDTSTGTFELAVQAPLNLRLPYLADFSDDPSHLIFESESALEPGAVNEKTNLYDLNHGTLGLVGRIPVAPAISCDDADAPACAPAPEGAFAGPYDVVGGSTSRGGASNRYYTQNTLSDDGSKTFFTAAGAGQLYVREDGTATTQISASQAAVPDPAGPRPAAFMGATPDGSKVFFTSCEKLTDDATAVSTASESCTEEQQGQDLYAYDTTSGELTDLTVDSNAGDLQGADVAGVLGTSSDGSYVYFTANGVLASGAAAGDCELNEVGSSIGDCSLYVSHEGSITFVARLNAETVDYENWIPYFESGGRFIKESRVADDGTLLFGSTQSLTGYDNALPNASATCSRGAGNRCFELHRYSPVDDELACISCHLGAPPTGPARLESRRDTAAPVTPATSLLTRNLSSDGKRAFFDTPDPLVSADVNGVTDPYEWEAEGTGSCDVGGASGGCLYLLSTGTSPAPSYLADISSTGDDAFFFTGQSLVPADRDDLTDVYDARVGGGLDSQYQVPVEDICSSSAACSGPGSSAPGEAAPGSSTFRGNPIKKPRHHCPKRGKKTSGKKKKCKKSKNSKPKKARGAHTNRGGSK